MDTEIQGITSMEQNAPTNRMMEIEMSLKNNRYGILADLKEKEENTIPNKEIKKTCLPIIIQGPPGDYQKLVTELKKTITSGNFKIYCTAKQTKIVTFNEKDHHNLREDLTKKNVEFYTYAPTTQRTKKIVVKAAPNMNEEELVKELEEKNFKTRTYKKLKPENPNSYSYLITTPKVENIGNLKKV